MNFKKWELFSGSLGKEVPEENVRIKKSLVSSANDFSTIVTEQKLRKMTSSTNLR